MPTSAGASESTETHNASWLSSDDEDVYIKSIYGYPNGVYDNTGKKVTTTKGNATVNKEGKVEDTSIQTK
jgi:hypothetical protein